jgi:hypothetical protein
MKVHGNTEHGLKRVGDNELFCKVRLQSWFQDHRQRYWVVDESKGSSRGGNGGGAEDDANARTEPGAAVGETTGGVIGEDDMLDGTVVGREDVEVIGEHSRAVIDDSEEVFSDFDDSEDTDYIESSQGRVSDDDDVGNSSEVEVDESNDESGGVSTVGDEEDMGSTERRQGTEDSESGHGSESVVEDDDDQGITRIRAGRVRKRKVRPVFEDRRGIGIDSEDEMYEPSSPGFRGQRGTKRQRRMSAFVDSGVIMMASSQDDGVFPASSPPAVGWMIPRRSEDVEEGVSEGETIVAGAVVDEGADAQSEDPFEPEFGWRHRGPGQPTLGVLRGRLEKWCRTCPACYLAREFGDEVHHMIDCWRYNTLQIIDETVRMQEHIEKFGGFRGRDGCPWCGIPRAICQRWHVQAGGGWEQVPEQQCQYRGMLIPAVIAMLMGGCNEGWAVAVSWMDREGVTLAKEADVFEWFREGIWWENIEVARIVRVFHMLVNKNRGVGRT